MVDIKRRSVAQGAAWSIPALAVASEAPALAASPGACTATINQVGQAYYQWGTVFPTDPNTTATTNQQLWFWGAISLAGLPADAQITSVTYTYWFQSRDDSVKNPDGSTGSHGPGVYDPGNTHSSLRQNGTCSISYSTITGCKYTYGSTPALTAPSTYNTNTATNPFTSGATDGAAVTAAWQTHTFTNGKTTRAWSFTFTGDPAQTQALLTKDSNGCLRLAWQDTPKMTIDYTNVLQSANAERTIQMDRIATVTYTSGGKTYTLTMTIPNTVLCNSTNYPNGTNAC